MKSCYLFIILIGIIFISCEDKETTEKIVPDFDQELVGTWIDSTDALPRGLIVYKLKINANKTFSSEIVMYGIYESDAPDDMSSWTELQGIVEQDMDSIYFLATTSKWWDSFYAMNPVNEDINSLLYESCTYSIEGNILELNYITYPADAPEPTIKTFIRKED